MKKHSKIYIAGHRGLVGSAIISRLKAEGYSNVITSMHSELDLTRQREVEEFFDKQRPDYVFLAAAKVGGIWANNTYRADFIYSNLTIQTNVIHACHYYKVDKLLFLGSSCIYPKHCPQPMKEEHLLSGYLESTNEPYAIAKIAGIKMCQAYHRQYGSRFISVMPTNLYGPNDNFDSETSHVLPALIRKFHEAKITGSDEVVLWGTGKPKREFLYVDDLADACIYLMDNYEDSTIINIGVGHDRTIRQLAELIAGVVGFDGALTFDSTKPDGTFQKLLDVSRIESLGWKAKVSLEQGIADTYKWYVENVAAK
ncbi:MAG: GDP-L-fucose synthase [Deltaproteobacteria bacterium]|nr:GDP-L-fucose synthase [Deltaproteobacteria bacterium]MBW2602057.1 GDP-L-fucose synthase [Deltaproteobacteria bacterium]